MMKIGRQILNILYGILIIFLIVAFPSISSAAVLLEDHFDGTGPGIVKGGELVTEGDTTGWISRSKRDPGNDGFSGSDYIMYEFPEGLGNLTPEGTVVLDLAYWRKGGKGYKNPDGTYSTLIDFINEDNSSAFLLYGVWEGHYGNGESYLTFWAPDRRALNVYGMWVPVVPKFQVGDKMEVAFTWGPDPATDNRVFINGHEVDQFFSNFERKTPGSRDQLLSELLRNVKRVRIGVASAAGKNYPDGDSPMYNTLMDRLVIHDTILTSRDLIPSIQQVAHNAFAVAGYSGKLVNGDTFTVTLKGEPGGTATFDLVQPASTSKGITTPERVRIAGHPMTEDPDNPGTYIGTHTVKYSEDVEDGQVVGHFTNVYGLEADPETSQRTLTVDTKVYMEVKSNNDLIPADENSRAGITIIATDANGKAVKSHPLELTMSTTDEYTGIVGGGTFEEMVGGELEVDWRGVTDSFGEVTAQYISGFAAKTILVSAKDMQTGDVGAGYVRSYIEGTVDVLVKRPAARALAIAGSMELSLSRDWLTADGRSRSRITAVVKDTDGKPLKGDQIVFTLVGDNGQIREIQSRTDSRGRATADYIAGTVIGQVQIEVRDMTSGLVGLVSIELRSDAPAEISLTAEPAEVFLGDNKGSVITAKVTDANGNPNANTDVLYEIITGGGRMSADSAMTDDKDGIAEASFLPGEEPGVSTIKATVMSRPATTEEIAVAEGAVFLFGLDEDPGRLEVLEWLAEPKDEVVEGQDLIVLEGRRGDTYTVKAPRDGIVSVFTAEERDRVEYGQTLGYILPLAE